ncbi:MAG: hypothetical protein U0168_19315 [Nannocystaceae bacterium]
MPTGPPSKSRTIAARIRRSIASALDVAELAQGVGGVVELDAVAAADLREVPHAAGQAVGDARYRGCGGPARAPASGSRTRGSRRRGARSRRARRRRSTRALDDLEALAQRCAQQRRAGGRADQRERRERERHGARTAALAHRKIDAAVLHRRVQALLDRGREPMDLVDEQHVARLERGQVPGEDALVLDRGARGHVDAHAHLGREDLRHRGLAQPRRPVQQHVIERLAALLGRVDEHPQLALERALADVLVHRARAQRRAQRGVLVAALSIERAAIDASTLVPGPRHLAHSHSMVAGGLLETS